MKCILWGKIPDARRNYFQCVYTRALAFSWMKNLLVKCQPFDRIYFFLSFSRFLFHYYKKYCRVSKALDKVYQQPQLGKKHSCGWHKGWREMSFTTTIVTFDPLLLVFQKMNPMHGRLYSKESIDFEVLECCHWKKEENKIKQSKLTLDIKAKHNQNHKTPQLSVVSGYVSCIMLITFCRKYISTSSKIKLQYHIQELNCKGFELKWESWILKGKKNCLWL